MDERRFETGGNFSDDSGFETFEDPRVRKPEVSGFEELRDFGALALPRLSG
jgi:hypothetical protein